MEGIITVTLGDLEILMFAFCEHPIVIKLWTVRYWWLSSNLK